MAGENLENGGQQQSTETNTGGEVKQGFTEADLLANDPEYQAMVEAEKAASVKDDKSGSGEKPPELDDNNNDHGNDDHGNDDDPGKNDDPPPKQEDNPPPADTETSEFEDNILPGLTGKQFESFDEPIREIIAKTREDLDKVTEKATKAEERLNKLLNDPIVQHREGVINGNNNTLPYKVPGLKDDTVSEIQKLIDQDTPESKAKVNELLTGHINSVAEIIANNVRIQEQARYQDQIHTKEAGVKLVALAKLAKVRLPSDDPNVIVNTDLSELGDIGKVVEEIKSRAQRGLIGNPKQYLAEIDVDELYAQMAIKNKWPLLKNADKIIQKQVRDANEKLYNRFLKGKPDEASGSFARGGQVDQRSSGVKTVKDGIDLIRLATDDNYHETILTQHNNGNWYRKVSELRQEGERMIEDNPRLHASSNKK